MEKINTHIPVFFTFNKHFVLPAAVAFYSLLEYANKNYYYELYVLHSDLSIKDQNKLIRAIFSFRNFASLHFINVDAFHKNSNWENLKSKQHYSKEIFNKLLAEIVFPQYDRIICSDVDVVFRGDISQSYFIPSKASYIAGVNGMVKSPIADWYLNNFVYDEIFIITHGIGAGYFVMNLDKIREDGVGKKMRAYYNANLGRLILPEQDVLNLCCYPKIDFLPLSYMVCTSLYSLNKQKIAYIVDDNNNESILEEALRNPIQIHYAGYNKPWNSFFIAKWSEWMKSLVTAGFITEYLKYLPYYLFQRRKKYNLNRFIGKVKRKVKKKSFFFPDKN